MPRGDPQECEQCQNVKLEREVETLSVALEPGMRDGQVRNLTSILTTKPPVVPIPNNHFRLIISRRSEAFAPTACTILPYRAGGHEHWPSNLLCAKWSGMPMVTAGHFMTAERVPRRRSCSLSRVSR